MRHTVSITFVLVILWLFNSGLYTGMLLGLGTASVILVVWLSRRMNILDEESQPFHLSARLPGYYLWLLKELLKSNLDVALRAWRGKDAILPRMEKLPVSQSSDLGRVIYANSLTLTPGTVAIELEDTTVLVHALTEEAMAELRAGGMNRRVQKLEGGS